MIMMPLQRRRIPHPLPLSMWLLGSALLHHEGHAKLMTDMTPCTKADTASKPLVQWMSTVSSTPNKQVEGICVGSDATNNWPIVQYIQDPTEALYNATAQYATHRDDCNIGQLQSGHCCMVDANGPDMDDDLYCIEEPSAVAICALAMSPGRRAVVSCENSGVLFFRAQGEIILDDDQNYLYFPSPGTNTVVLPDGRLQLTPGTDTGMVSVFVVIHTSEFVYNSGVCQCYSPFKNNNPLFSPKMSQCAYEWTEFCPDPTAPTMAPSQDPTQAPTPQPSTQTPTQQPSTQTSTQQPTLQEIPVPDDAVLMMIADLVEISDHLATIRSSTAEMENILALYNITRSSESSPTTISTPTQTTPEPPSFSNNVAVEAAEHTAETFP